MLKRLRSTSVLLALGYIGLFGISTLLLVGLLWWRTAGYLERETESAITNDANQIREQLHDFGLLAAEDAIKVRTAESHNGAALYLLSGKHLKPLAGNLAAWPAEIGRKSGWYRIMLERDGRLRPIRLRSVALPGGLHLLVGRDIGDRTEIRALIIDALTWAGITSLLLAIGGGLLVRRSVLRRVEMINAAAAAIVRGDLSRRVPMRGTTDEFDQLARTINSMLQQIQQLIEGVRNTANAVAHDLRTPLAELRARLEELLRTRPSPAASFQEIQKAVSDIDRVIAVFNALLRLAEIDSGVRRSGFREVDLGEIATEVADLYGALAEEKRVSFLLDAPAGLMVDGDPYLLAQAAGNLADNAIKFTPLNGVISLRVMRSEDCQINIVIADSGPGIAEFEKTRVTERFYRSGLNRAADGKGLGLSVVEAVARIHHGTLELSDNNPGLVATLRLPAIPVPDAVASPHPSTHDHSGFGKKMADIVMSPPRTCSAPTANDGFHRFFPRFRRSSNGC
jgi:signal transduction histidine kinase